ncbi:MAG: cyclic 2,3-diphosphoglycerate synthase [Firmicutes bacterium]|nr:cyclic 2,3-diphosphoglycerate synthase [Bacillota bacterium]
MKNIIIMGAAGRDFHNFNTYFRDRADIRVVAFTATQISGIDNRMYPKELAGRYYSGGIQIYPESQLEELIRKYDVDEVIFAYSDVSQVYVMELASKIIAWGADFRLMGPKSTMLKSNRAVISITATRTGSGKSQVSRYIGKMLLDANIKTVIIRHPMPYGVLAEQKVQRFSTIKDLDKYNCTIEEREEYEPHLEAGLVVYAGVDYGAILKKAEKEADFIIWDGGNNDFSFYVPDIKIVVVDPLRIGDEKTYYPGESNLLSADIVIINKVNSALAENVEKLKETIISMNPKARIILANSKITVDEPDLIKGKRVLVIEDGPTLTHGRMSFGAGVVAAKEFGASELIDPHPFAVGSIGETLDKWKQLRNLVPAMGYSEEQIKELELTINNSGADLIVVGSPIDLNRIMKINIPVVRVRYDLEEVDSTLGGLLVELLDNIDH